eukprot:1389026-Amorphochlora_amoeboformis.AAC.2
MAPVGWVQWTLATTLFLLGASLQPVKEKSAMMSNADTNRTSESSPNDGDFEPLVDRSSANANSSLTALRKKLDH